MDWILPGNGAAELLTWIARDLAALSACYLITPAFGDYRRSLKAFGGEVRACPLSLAAVATDEVDWLATLLTNLQHDPSQCGLLLNSPHNPTGLTIPRQVIQKLLTCFGLVVVDEAFMDFLPPAEQDRHSLLNQVTDWENLVVLRSLTKFYSLPGLRLGYAIAPPHQLQRWQQWRDPWPVNSLAAVAAEAALVDTEFQQQTWEWLAETRPNLLTQLSAITGIQPVWGTANYLLLRCDRPGTELQRELLQHHHILIRDCLSFSELGDHYVRIAIRTEVENQQLVAALRSQLDMG
jgi:histidinol-phosphate/aromatic aminotransferase/cobyric acid decarboxylase-like protein